MSEFVAVCVWLGVRLHRTDWTIWKTRLLIKLNKQNSFISVYSSAFCIIYSLCVCMCVSVSPLSVAKSDYDANFLFTSFYLSAKLHNHLLYCFVAIKIVGGL